MSASAPVSSRLPWVNPLTARLHPPIFGIFLLVLGVDILRLGLGERWPGLWGVLTPAVWLAAALTLLVGLSRRLPMQNVVAVAALAAGLGFLVDALNASTDIPFGRRVFSPPTEPHLLGVAWVMPFLWLTLAVGGRGVARLILRPWRKLTYYGLWVMAVATGLSLVTALAFEPFGRAQGWWLRETPEGTWTWYGAPVVSFFGWGVATLTIYGFTTPWMLNKQPVKQPTDWHPLFVWGLLLFWLTLSNALAGDWISALVAGGVVGTTLVLAVRGGSW